MIVADTNLITGAYLPGQHTEAIRSVMMKDADWVAPYLWRSEIRNVLWHYLKHGRMSMDSAKRVAMLAEERMRGQEFWTPADRILDLSALSGCTSYDCEFVFVAMDLKVSLVTLDKWVLRQFPDIAVSPEGFVSR